MKKIVLAAVATGLMSFGALADEKPTEDEAAKIKATLTEWGFEGGVYEKESEATGVYEIDDAKKIGVQYDVKLDKDFKVILISAD